MAWTIERATQADRKPIEQLLADCGGPTEDLVGSWHESFLVAQDCRVITGVVGLETYGSLGLVRSLATLPGHRGQGIASELVERVEERARAVGIVWIYGLTTTAEAFFVKRGYERVDRSEVPEAIRDTAEFRELCPETAVCLRKEVV